jgi:hypothetical protein
MSATALSLPPPIVPPEVLAFAAEQRVSEYLPIVLALARRLFPREPMTVRVDDDPEIEDYRKIAIEVDVTGWQTPQLVAVQQQWTEQLIRSCPAHQAIVFRLDLR